MTRGPPIRTLLALAGVWVLLGALSSAGIYLLSLAESPAGQAPSPVGIVVQQGPRWMGWILLTPLVLWLGRRFPLRPDRIVGGLAFHAGVGAAVALLHVAWTGWIYALTVPSFPAGSDATSFYLGFAASQLPFSILAYAALLGGVTARDYYGELREREIGAARLEARLHEARLEALRAHLDPHFLFNALQAASSLVRRHPDRAVRTLARVGELLRAALDERDRHQVTLEEELDLLAPYLDIVRTRFPDRLSVRVDVPPAVRGVRVPPFLLQPLVENAIRHGIEPRSSRGRVEVSARRRNGKVVIAVRDDGGGRPAPPAATWREGTGLRVTRERLEALHPGAHELRIASLDSGGAEVVVRLPLPDGDDDGGSDA